MKFLAILLVFASLPAFAYRLNYGDIDDVREIETRELKLLQAKARHDADVIQAELTYRKEIAEMKKRIDSMTPEELVKEVSNMIDDYKRNNPDYYKKHENKSIEEIIKDINEFSDSLGI
jgi:Tfp pilus assembly protein PilO